MAITTPGQTLDTVAAPYTASDPGQTVEAVDPGIPTGYVAPTAWAYATFPNEAPILWERAWYKGKTSGLVVARHSVLAGSTVRIDAQADASVVTLTRVVDLGAVTGTVVVLAMTAPMPGRSVSGSRTIRVTGQAVLGAELAALAPPAQVHLDGTVEALSATPIEADALIALTGLAQADALTGLLASDTIRVAGLAGALSARQARSTGALRLTGTVKAAPAPSMPLVPSVIRVAGSVSASVIRGGIATGAIRAQGTLAASLGWSASASGTVRVTASDAVSIAGAGQIVLTGAATLDRLAMAKAVGVVRVQVVSSRASLVGEPYAVGVIRVHAATWESWEAACLPAVVSVTSFGKGIRVGTAKVLGQITVDATATLDVHSSITPDPADIDVTGAASIEARSAADAHADLTLRASGDAIVGAQAQADGLVGVYGLAGAASMTDADVAGLVEVDGQVDPHVAVEGTAQAQIVIAGQADARTAAGPGGGSATIVLSALGDAVVTGPPIAYGRGDAYLDLDAGGTAHPIRAGRSTGVVIHLRAAGSGARTVQADPSEATIRLYGYGTLLSIRSIREHVLVHRADKRRMTYSVTKTAVIYTGARDIVQSHSVTDPSEVRVRITEVFA